MAVFTVHLPPAGESAPEKAVFLRDGFSWSAFFFGPFWLIWKRAWLAAAGWSALLAVIALFGVVFKIQSGAMAYAGFAAALVLGFEGGRILAWSLQRRGYVEGDLVIGDNEEEAEEVWFGRRRASSPDKLPAESGA